MAHSHQSRHFDSKLLGDNIQSTSRSPDNVNLVYFDLETSGFEKTADILQIAAKCGKRRFCKYVNPTQLIMPRNTISGFKNVDGTLFLNNERVLSSPLQKVLCAFKRWLAALKPCILVAHNGLRFDFPLLFRALKKKSMIEDFEKLIVGFADTLIILRKIYPERKGPEMFKLSTLAQELKIKLPRNFHNAAYDVQILEKIASKIIFTTNETTKKILAQNMKSFTKLLAHETRLQKAAVLRPSLNFLEGVISKGMIKKLTNANINRIKLQAIYKKSGREGVVKFLSAKQKDNKPRVTKNNKILDKIVDTVARL
ncbi:DNA polymerase III PolC-type [Formica fusca]